MSEQQAGPGPVLHLPSGARCLLPWLTTVLHSRRAGRDVVAEISRSLEGAGDRWRGVARESRFKVYRWRWWTSARIVAVGHIEERDSGSVVIVRIRPPWLAVFVLFAGAIAAMFVAVGGSAEGNPAACVVLLLPVCVWLACAFWFRVEAMPTLEFVRRAL